MAKTQQRLSEREYLQQSVNRPMREFCLQGGFCRNHTVMFFLRDPPGATAAVAGGGGLPVAHISPH
eukprot:3319786-Amphidinium_carterae.1